MRSRAAFLDRDGVLNRKQPPSRYVTSPEELHVLPGVGAAVSRLNEAGYKCILVTNQRGIGRGLMTEADLSLVHHKLVDALAADGAVLDEIRYCPHDYDAHCACRKPGAGMLLDAVAEHDLETSTSIMFGDSSTDIEAAAAAGVDAIFIGSPADLESLPADHPQPVAIHADLPSAVEWLLTSPSQNEPNLVTR